MSSAATATGARTTEARLDNDPERSRPRRPSPRACPDRKYLTRAALIGTESSSSRMPEEEVAKPSSWYVEPAGRRVLPAGWDLVVEAVLAREDDERRREEEAAAGAGAKL